MVNLLMDIVHCLLHPLTAGLSRIGMMEIGDTVFQVILKSNDESRLHRGW